MRKAGPVTDPRRTKQEVLAECETFDLLPQEALARLARRARVERYTAGQALFRVGDASGSIYVISLGRVAAVISSGGGRSDLVVHVAGPGEAAGSLDLVDDGARTVSAIAQGDVEVLILPAAAVRGELIAHPEALMEHAATLTRICRALGDRAHDLVFLDLHGRLAKHLLTLAADGDIALFDESQTNLAERLGAARQSLNRSLGRLQREGAIQVLKGGSGARILDRDALEAVAIVVRPGLSHR